MAEEKTIRARGYINDVSYDERVTEVQDPTIGWVRSVIRTRPQFAMTFESGDLSHTHHFTVSAPSGVEAHPLQRWEETPAL